MPAIKIDHIVSFSSEDPVHTANNILSTDTSKKWKCRTAGEKQATAVLQLEKASQITAIDIGNEHSAYIEILVSRSSNTDDYKVLLVTSTFMTPLEARQSQNVNKVRMFTKDQLSKPECEEKWDRIKIVCTQPFNKHVQFGLSFITLHSNENTGTGTTGLTKIGKFLIRPESPDNLTAGNLFSKRKEFKEEVKTPTAAAAIRDATSSSFSSPTCKPKLLNKDHNLTPKRPSLNKEEPSRKDRNRDELFYTDDDKKGSEKIDKIMKKKEEEDRSEQKRKKLFDVSETPKNKKKKLEEEKQPKDKDKNTKKEGDSPKNELKRKKRIKLMENEKPKKSKITKPFNKLLEGVVLVISGIQNPERSNLRSMALAMGANYKRDWESTCTHLICAFLNTPKFNQVKGKGKIVKQSWLESCYKERKKLPWRRFALDKTDSNEPESEEEIEEFVDKPSTSKREISEDSDDEHKAEGSDTEERVTKILQKKNQKDKNILNDDLHEDEEVMEINRIQNSKNDISENNKSPNIFEIDTDDEPEICLKLKNSPPNIFGGDKFYVDHTFDDKTYSTLCKYITAYKGICIDDITDHIDVIVTTKQNSSTMKEVNENAKCVRSSWIMESHSKQKMLPIGDFIF